MKLVERLRIDFRSSEGNKKAPRLIPKSKYTTLCYTIRGGDILPVSKEKTRISVTLTKEEYQKLKNKAKEENRSISNLASKILSDYLKNNK